MRPLAKWLCILPLIGTALSVTSADKKSSDRQIDGFSGPVKSVSTRVEKSAVKLQQPNGPAVVSSSGCQQCDYDQGGNRITLGQTNGTNVHARFTELIRDSTGAVTERIEKNEKGQITGRSVLGPFGPAEDTLYSDGQLASRRTYRYDAKGNLIETVTLDSDGTEARRSTMTYDDAGHVVEEWDRGPNNSFQTHFVHTYDPKTHFETWTTLPRGAPPIVFRGDS